MPNAQVLDDWSPANKTKTRRKPRLQGITKQPQGTDIGGAVTARLFSDTTSGGFSSWLLTTSWAFSSLPTLSEADLLFVWARVPVPLLHTYLNPASRPKNNKQSRDHRRLCVRLR